MGTIKRLEALSVKRSLELQEEFGGTLAVHRIFSMAGAQGAKTLTFPHLLDQI